MSGAGKIALGVALSLCLTLAVGGVAEAKKSKTFSEQKAVGALVPQSPAAGQPYVPLNSEIKVPKKYKGKAVGDLNVTAFQTTGSAANAAVDLDVYLTAPNGRKTLLIFALPGQSFGPWTMDDDSRTQVCTTVPPPCTNPLATLSQPFAGTTNLLGNYAGGIPAGPLSSFNGVKMRGTWTLTVYDVVGATTSTLNQWGLQIKPAKPVSE